MTKFSDAIEQGNALASTPAADLSPDDQVDLCWVLHRLAGHDVGILTEAGAGKELLAQIVTFEALT
jgi:hypothetical protein